MPIVRTMPAMPGRVSVAPRPETPRAARGPGKQRKANRISMPRVREATEMRPPVP